MVQHDSIVESLEKKYDSKIKLLKNDVKQLKQEMGEQKQAHIAENTRLQSQIDVMEKKFQSRIESLENIPKSLWKDWHQHKTNCPNHHLKKKTCLRGMRQNIK